ncbi:MAG: hypothetical protein L3J17_04455 [Candidatus Jettenia sp.]|nr:MAG: hypothetical protein L3J17_04455 [Candidatus Jettenia sp.]
MAQRLDTIRWCDQPELLLPERSRSWHTVPGLSFPWTISVATIVVPNDQLSLAIGKRGQNVRLAARLTSWDIDIITESELEERQKSHAVELTEVAETNKMPSSDLPAKHEISRDNIETSDKKEES